MLLAYISFVIACGKIIELININFKVFFLIIGIVSAVPYGDYTQAELKRVLVRN
jgi:hypothetical protein